MKLRQEQLGLFNMAVTDITPVKMDAILAVDPYKKMAYSESKWKIRVTSKQ